MTEKEFMDQLELEIHIFDGFEDIVHYIKKRFREEYPEAEVSIGRVYRLDDAYRIDIQVVFPFKEVNITFKVAT